MIKNLIHDFTNAFCKHAIEAKEVELTGKNTDQKLVKKRLKDKTIEDEIKEDKIIEKWSNSDAVSMGWAPIQ